MTNTTFSGFDGTDGDTSMPSEIPSQKHATDPL
jgi:hypothetical protein